MYDQREKAQRDYEWAMASAREEGYQEGLELGREDGRIDLWMLIGRIQLLQDLLKEPVTPKADLFARSTAELSSLIADLQERFDSAERRRDESDRRDQD